MRKKEIRFLQDSLSACCLFFSQRQEKTLWCLSEVSERGRKLRETAGICSGTRGRRITESEKEKEEPKNRYLEIDFAGLKAVNPDVIAWIQIPALDISYPVVQGKDNAYYLHHLFRENPISTGASLWTAIISRTLRIRIRSCTGII